MDASPLLLLVGGARSGKSALAQLWAESISKSPLFLATCRPADPEMEARVARHRTLRPANWKTLEEPINLLTALENYCANPPQFYGSIVIDCLSAWLANLLEDGRTESYILSAVDELFDGIRQLGVPAAFVSAECGLGFTPLNPLARKFGDLLGAINQLAASRCNPVLFCSCGLALPFKGRLPKVLETLK